MTTDLKEIITKERMIALFEKNRKEIFKNDPEQVSELRQQAFDSFIRLGFPTTRMEEWKNTDLKEWLGKEYDYPLKPQQGMDAHQIFRCNIPHLDTAIIGQVNGWYVSKDVPLIRLGNGMILGSLAQAFREYPEIILPHYGKYAGTGKSGLTDLNTAFACDGIFIYVPDHVQSPKPIQLINVIQHDENIFLQSRNLILLGKDARLSLVHCDDSYNHQASFSNIVTEVHLDEGAVLDHYKLQNLNNNSVLISNTAFHLEKEAELVSNFLTLNGGMVRNNTDVLLNGSHGNASIYGLYLMDRKQHIDNHVYVDHAATDCTSVEMFKGILDENSSGVFNGHVYVRKDAQKTNATQSNRNILLTDTARVYSRPFLEIYADDVKCGHGSTTGQLDNEAMFYLMQRGIGPESARMLLMFAFANEIVGKISIPELRFRIEDMVKKRLQGELQICEQCVLHCSTPEHPMEFDIDLSKI
ncbi:MAG: Fe-S cluster assembly protein SufD [Bacteroidetes bacterium]|nr:Fe-S cluster assembly protein SufD [Bacteroidota bacterium]